ncbi:MAG: formyltransferase family protein [Alphaproteobacteria bacterium]
MSKIAIITRENVFGNIILNKAIPALIDQGYDPTVYVTSDPDIKGMDSPEHQHISKMETGLYRDAVAPFLDDNPLTADGDPITGVNYTLDQLAEMHRINVVDVTDVNHQSFIDEMDSFDGAINVRGLTIFEPPLVDALSGDKFFYNLHPGLLPEYKGLLTPFHSALDGEKTVGQSLHKIDNGIDTGDIVMRKEIPFNPQQPIFDTYLELCEVGNAMIIDAMGIRKEYNGVPSIKQSPSEKRDYNPLPDEEMLTSLKSNGVEFGDSEHVMQAYLSLYSKPDTQHATALLQVMNDYLQGRDNVLEHSAVAPA